MSDDFTHGKTAWYRHAAHKRNGARWQEIRNEALTDAANIAAEFSEDAARAIRSLLRAPQSATPRDEI